MEVLHVSTVHRSADQRILWKEAQSAASRGARVVVAARGDVNNPPVGVGVEPLPERYVQLGRLLRMILGAPLAILVAVRRMPDVVHLHDPELIPATRVLQRLGAAVVYDAHEDLERQVASRKPYVPAILQGLVRRLASRLVREAAVADGIVAATPVVGERFPVAKTIVFRNTPLPDEIRRHPAPGIDGRVSHALVLGGLSASRLLPSVVRAFGQATLGEANELHLAGSLDPEFNPLPEGWSAVGVRHLGVLDRDAVWTALSKARVGVCLLPRLPDYDDAYPVKVFEYLCAGLPVLVSSGGHMGDLVARTGAGLVADASDVEGLAEALGRLLREDETWMECHRAALQVREQLLESTSDADRLWSLYSRLSTKRDASTNGSELVI